MKEVGRPVIDCNKCIYFFITWDKNFPRGCRLFGFKSNRMPSFTVHEATGKPCQSFKRKS